MLAVAEQISFGRLQNAVGILLKEGSSFVISIHKGNAAFCLLGRERKCRNCGGAG